MTRRGITQSVLFWAALGAFGLAVPGCKREPRREVHEAADSIRPLGAKAPVIPAAPSTPSSQAPAWAPPPGAPKTFADLAQQANPAVVFVRTLHSERYGLRRVMNEGSGSGFVFDRTGLILTNYHVVRQASAIQVELLDDRKLPAQVVGADPLTDVAVLRVSAEGLVTLPLGDSDRIRVGDWVVAIGNPFGLAHTVSAGILSARERTTEDIGGGDPRAYVSFLQTDASINPGNSGGPLLNTEGQVVGINTAINPEANSIGFAIPINMVRELLPRLLADGVIERAAIGVHVADSSLGAQVLRLVPGGPAHRAGLEEQDIIVEFDGHPIRDGTALRWRASLSPIGKSVPLVVLRGGRRLKLEVLPVLLDYR